MLRIGLRCFRLQVALALLLVTAMFSSLRVRAQAGEQVILPARVTHAINESSLVTLRGNTHPLAQAKYDHGPAPLSMPANRLQLVLRRSAEQEAALSTYLESVQDPDSANYHKWLTPDQFGKLYGISDADLATVQNWLQGHGFAVSNVAKSRMAIEFSGTVGQVQAAFHTSLHSYVVNGEQHWANATDPQIPAALSSVVAGLAELNNFVPRAQFKRGPSGVYNSATRRIEPTYTVGDSSSGYTIFLGPADAATIYDTPTTYNVNHSGTVYDGAGIHIGIAGDSNIDVTQNANYRATFGLSPNATQVVVDGADPGENGDAIEAYLDTQVAGGIASGATVTLYTAADTTFNAGLFLAISRALDENQVDILNVSFGGCEAAQGASGNQYIYSLWEQAAAQGISVTVSTGDSGSAGCDNENTENVAQYGLAVNGLASTPYNVAVGGTDFDTLYGTNFPASFTTYVNIGNSLPYHRSALSYIPEEPWNDSTFQGDNTTINRNVPWTATQYSSYANIVAGGGGASSCTSLDLYGRCVSGYPLPSWQSGFATNNTARNLPDVSFLAGNGLYGATWGLCTDQDFDSSGNVIPDCAGTPTTGNNFNVTGVGGTSAAAPAFAGILALAAQKAGDRLGQPDYVLYKLAKSKYSTVFHTVATGNNSVPCAVGSANCNVTSSGYYYLSGYNAQSGYNEAAGLGSVDATQLLNNWNSASATATTSSLTLNGGTSALTLTHGASVTVNASVTGSGGTPTGQVALVDNLDPATLPNNEGIATIALSGGTASGATNSFPGGSYRVTAHYGGDGAFAQSDSNAIPVTVSAESSSTTLTVAGYYDPTTGNKASTPYYGYLYLIDAQPYGNSASAANPNGAATGAITFKSGASTLGAAAVTSNGIAELQTAIIPGGPNSLTASFPGDASFQASTSSPVSFTVTPAVTMLGAPTYQPSVISAGSAVTLSAALSANSAGAAPTGTVTFMSGSTPIGSAQISGKAATASTLAAGTASLTTTSLPSGSNTLTAIYGGDGNYAGSTSSSNILYVSKAASSLTITPPAPTITTNQALQITVTPTPVAGLPLPSGSVTLQLNGVTPVVPPVGLVNGAAIVAIPANTFKPGTYGISIGYSGDNNYASNVANLTIIVNSSGTIKPTVAMAPPTGTVNFPFSTAIAVSGPAGDPVPTGSVTLSSPNYIYPTTAQLVNGSASIVVTCCMPGGPNALTATYLGDDNYTSGVASGSVTLLSMANVIFFNFPSGTPVNQPLTFVVNIASNGYTSVTAPPTGTVTLTWGTYTSAPGQLSGGSTTITIPANSLTVGSNLLTATYSGDVNYAAASNEMYLNITPAVPAGFTMTGNAVTIVPGATAGNASTVTVTPAGGFTGSVALTAAITSSPAGAVYPPTLSFGATSPVSITGSTAGTAMLTVSTTAATTASLAQPARSNSGWYSAGGLALASLLLWIRPSRRRRWRTMLGLALFFVALTNGLLACGGGGSTSTGGSGITGTTPGNYTITVTGTSGTLTATTTISLTVN